MSRNENKQMKQDIQDEKIITTILSFVEDRELLKLQGVNQEWFNDFVPKATESIKIKQVPQIKLKFESEFEANKYSKGQRVKKVLSLYQNMNYKIKEFKQDKSHNCYGQFGKYEILPGNKIKFMNQFDILNHTKTKRMNKFTFYGKETSVMFNGEMVPGGLEIDNKDYERATHRTLHLIEGSEKRVFDYMTWILDDGKHSCPNNQDLYFNNEKLQKELITNEVNLIKNQFKIRMCGRHEEGCCKKGSSCKFAHSEKELRKKRDFMTQKQILEGIKAFNSQMKPEQFFQKSCNKWTKRAIA